MPEIAYKVKTLDEILAVSAKINSQDNTANIPVIPINKPENKQDYVSHVLSLPMISLCRSNRTRLSFMKVSALRICC